MVTKKKTALITGITGQDGSYLAEFLLSKDYEVYGTVRKTSHFLYANIVRIQSRLHLIQSDLLDPVSLTSVLSSIGKIDEIYNLASQSSASESFKQPVHTAEITGIGAQRIMEAAHEMYPKVKIYQASSSEMFGWVRESPQNEQTPFNPANPYAAAKLYAHNIAQIYRKSYGMFISCGILFNHESPIRGLNFVTQKVAYGAACVKLGIKTSDYLNEEGEPILKDGKIALGNMDAKRDWGFAKDYVEAMWLMLQQKKPDNYVIATGEVHTIKDLCETAFSYVGHDWKKYVFIDKRFIRPTETGPLVGDYSKAKKILKWKPRTHFKELIELLVDTNIARLK